MKLTCKRESLLAACQMANAAIATVKNVKPILRNLHASVTADGCAIMATDLETGILIRIAGVEVEDAGDALIPAELLLKILRESDADEVAIKCDLSETVVVVGGSRYEMLSDDPAHYPTFPQFDDESPVEVQATTLQELIRRVVFATASTENSRFGATTGVAWEIDGPRLSLVATDGRSLALASGACTGGGQKLGVLPVVPVKALTLLDRSIDGEETVKIAFRPDDVLLKTERVTVYSRLINGHFPGYRKVIPKDSKSTLTIAAGVLLRACRQANIMTDTESKGINFVFERGCLTLTASGAQSGKSKVEVPIEWPHKRLDVRFDPEIFAAPLKLFSPDQATEWHLADRGTPALMRVGTDYTYVAVPLATDVSTGGK